MKRLFRAVSLALFALLVCMALPHVALARSYEVATVDIQATVRPDGSVEVLEQRSYDFSGSFNGIYWDVPQGSYQGRPVRARVSWVGAIASGGQTLFEAGSEGAPGTYELTDEGDYLRLKLYWPATDEAVTFQVSYELTNLATRWADVGELYWKYVQSDPSSELEWHNVSCTVKLPQPDGAAVTPGETVRAWGHGPLDGEVSFEGDKVRFFSPGVGSEEFLEARIAFPGEWLDDMPALGAQRLESILAEEGQWAEEANAERLKARLVQFGLPALMCLLGAGSFVARFAHERLKKARGPKAQFRDTYYRDVPTNDHPAVLGMLYHDGELDGKAFSATLMRLVDMGRATMDTVMVEKKGKRGGGTGKFRREWHMVLRKDAPEPGPLFATRAGGKKIDDAAFDFLFDVVANKHKHQIDPQLQGPQGEPYVLAAFFDEAAEGWPDAYRRGYHAWSAAVTAAWKKRKFVKREEDDLVPGLLALGDIALAVVMGIACIFLQVDNLLASVGVIVLFGCGIGMLLMDDDDDKVYTYSQEGVEVRAKLEALRRWLCDFTRLEEAIPTDVVLWNRLLVMATVLGVADEVVKQLKAHVPSVLRDPGFVACSWYAGDLDQDFEPPVVATPRAEVPSGSSGHHSVSSYDTARSHNSSSRGSGGGFSGGGGGGFSGGGGRGGAF